jgi:hypothetical protein
MSTWGVLLNGVYLGGGHPGNVLPDGCVPLPDESGCLTVPPDGLGLPGLRVEDVTFPQRDGVRHFSDWYEPRIITLQVSVCPDSCPGCPSARAKVKAIVEAWSRQCGDVEMVLFTDCHGEDEDRALVGPFGVIGRPRAAVVEWAQGPSKCADLTLRFDATDHRLYVLDECGTPGSGVECHILTPNVFETCRTYDKCYPYCYDQDTGSEGGPVEVTVGGSLCVYPTITLCGGLSSPTVENLTTGEFIRYTGNIAAGECIIIDTQAGTAVTETGASRTHLLAGNPRMQLDVGVNELRLISSGVADDGTAEVCFRAQVVMA